MRYVHAIPGTVVGLAIITAVDVTLHGWVWKQDFNGANYFIVIPYRDDGTWSDPYVAIAINCAGASTQKLEAQYTTSATYRTLTSDNGTARLTPGPRSTSPC